ncbi:hypothetical protein OHU07_12695 [Streptomyces phaeochromogenes]
MALISPDVAPTVAVASLTVAIISLALAFYSFRTGGPKVSVQCYIAKEPSGEYFLRLVMSNRGRTATTINVGQLDVSWQYDDNPAKDTHRTLWPVFPETLPYRLEGHTPVQWSCPATELMTVAINMTPNTWRLHVKVGHRTRKVRVSKKIAHVTKVGVDPLR